MRSKREVEVPLEFAPLGVELPITMKPFPLGMTVSVPFAPLVPSVVEVALLPPKIEPIDTVADASDERALGTILTIPMLKNTNINKIAPMTTTLSKVFICKYYIIDNVYLSNIGAGRIMWLIKAARAWSQPWRLQNL